MHNIINKKKVFSARFSMNGSNLFQIMRVKLQSPSFAQWKYHGQ